jgi:peptide/nickel transport system substrate-binding protein
MGTAWSQTLRWASQGDLLTLDPHAQNESLTNSINGQVYETLVLTGKKLELEPGLAVSWESLSPLHWRFKLRPGVRFHDGRPFTADDVVFSIQRAKAATSGFQAYANALGTPQKVDDLTVDLLLKDFNPILLQHLSKIFVLSKSWSEENGASLPQDFKNREEKFTSTHTNGTGPFSLVSRQVDARTIFKKNPGWWGRWEGNVQEVVYTPVKSDGTRTAALISGDLDLVLDPPLQDVERLRSEPAVQVMEGVESRIIFIGMDQGRDELLYSNIKGRNPFKDVRVRRALYQAIDIEALRTNIMRGLSVPTGALAATSKEVFDDQHIERRLPFDLVTARRLLAEAGYPDGFEVTLDCPNNRYINDEKICVALSAMWAQIGVRVRVVAQPRATYFPKAERLETSMYLLGWGGSLTDAEVTLTPVMRSRGTGGVGQYNWGNHSNPRLDELATMSSRETDPVRREQLIKAAMREHNDQVHHLPLHRQVIPWAMRSHVTAVHRADNWLEWRWIRIAKP